MQGIPGGGTLLNNHQHDAKEAAIECIGFSLLTLSGLVPDLEVTWEKFEFKYPPCACGVPCPHLSSS